jgi:hypothetical protein
MATRSEQFRANEQRKPSKRTTPSGSTARRPSASSRPTEHARKKATYAFESTLAGQRPSRKSSRGSANRAKPDASLNILESLVKGSPEARFRKASAKGKRVRGSAGT